MGAQTILWLSLIIIGVLTFGLRLGFIALADRVSMPAWFERGLRFVPVAALTAILVPEILKPAGTLDLSLGNARLLAGALAVVVAWRTKNVLLTIAVGMASLLILQAVFGALGVK
jgi:branched-subunit amino acid transport protein